MDAMTATETTATMTAATEEEAAAIRAWAEALRAAEEILCRARPDSVRFDVLYDLHVDHVHSLIGQIRSERRAVQAAAEKISSSVSDDAR